MKSIRGKIYMNLAVLSLIAFSLISLLLVLMKNLYNGSREISDNYLQSVLTLGEMRQRFQEISYLTMTHVVTTDLEQQASIA